MNRVVNKILGCCAGMLLLLIFCSAPALSRALTIGTVTEFPEEHFLQFRALGDYLEKKLSEAGVDRVRILLPGSLRSMAYLLKQEKMDLVFDSPLSLAAVAQLSDLEFLLRQGKEGGLDDQAVIFVKKDVPFEGPSDLKGATVAMKNPTSSSGYWIPKYYLTQAGLDFVRVYRAGEKPPPNKTGYAFTYSDTLAMEWVHRGFIKAGAVSSMDFEKEKSKYPDLKTLWLSPVFHRQVVAYRPGLDPSLRDKIREILLNMNQDPEGQKVLAIFYQSTRFDPFPEGPEDYKKSLEVFSPFLKKELEL